MLNPTAWSNFSTKLWIYKSKGLGYRVEDLGLEGYFKGFDVTYCPVCNDYESNGVVQNL
jgi:hypothetical protein